MIRHAVRVRFAADADTAARNRVLSAFIALGDHLGHVSSFACGAGADPDGPAAGYPHAFVVVLETQAAFDRYRALPEYADALARLAEVAEGGADGISVASAAPD